MKEAKAKHLQRLEGKDYVVKDGDIIYFRSGLLTGACPEAAIDLHSPGVRSTAPAVRGESLLGRTSRLARQSESSRSDEP